MPIRVVKCWKIVCARCGCDVSPANNDMIEHYDSRQEAKDDLHDRGADYRYGTLEGQIIGVCGCRERDDDNKEKRGGAVTMRS